MPRLFRFDVKSALLALFCFWVAGAASGAEFATAPLDIRLQNGKVLHFVVELATTRETRELGLMNRDAMPDNAGMLFDFGETRPVYMWMKNTYLPLDMLFVTETGRIAHIQADAMPLSETIIDSRGPVRFVLELNGGVAARMGIHPGDTVVAAQITGTATPDK